MDIVKALNSYRKTVSEDPTAFELLCFLYKDGARTEADLKELTGIDDPPLKSALRDLYQADFIRTNAKGRFSLSSFGEDVLSEMGVDRIVIKYLLNEMSPRVAHAEISRVAELAIDAEPDRARLAAQSLRNLQVFLSHNLETSAPLRSALIINCINPSTSIFRAVVGSTIHNSEWTDRLSMPKRGRGEKSEPMTTYYEAACSLSDGANAYLTNLIWTRSMRSIPHDTAVYMSFRFFNYLHSEERDHVLEYAISRANSQLKASLFKRLWKFLSGVSKSEYLSVNLLASIRSADHLMVVMDNAIQDKTQRYSITWRSHRRVEAKLFEDLSTTRAAEPTYRIIVHQQEPSVLGEQLPAKRRRGGAKKRGSKR